MKKNISSKLFLYFCTLAALFMSVSGFLTAKNIGGLIFQLIFLPITLFLLISSIKSLVNKNYSTGINITKSKAIIFAILFLILAGSSIKSVLDKQKENVQTTPEPLVITVSPSSSPEVVAKYLTIKSTSPTLLVNIRASNNTSSEIIEKAEDGKIFEYINFENNWYEIVLENEKVGWVFSGYIDLKENGKEK